MTEQDIRDAHAAFSDLLHQAHDAIPERAKVRISPIAHGALLRFGGINALKTLSTITVLRARDRFTELYGEALKADNTPT